jgi:UDP-N-acetylglucosamine--N-acetylmuramyl-(pentapeptide) pyrophosphoryl-undecaprenol N-acetylglucosamine transferase
MRIVMTGGGSGGHITPILAVAYQVKQLNPDCEIDYVGQTGDKLGDIPAQDPSIDHAYTVRAGKLRRYHGEGVRQLLDVSTMAKNVRDTGYVVTGITQSYRLLRRLRPDVVFIKGGFVGVPVGIAAARLGIPYVTHDSDALPGLANRIIARWARLHTVALPKEVYAYPTAKTITVGVPISHEFRPRTVAEVSDIKKRLHIPEDSRVLLVTGGGLGAQRLNDAMVRISSKLLDKYPELVIIHLAGRAHDAAIRQDYAKALTDKDQRARVVVEGFITNLYDFSAIADVVVTRAGGNSMAELAAQAKACIVVPNPYLTGGHQLKNAQVLADRMAVRIVNEPELVGEAPSLCGQIVELLDDDKVRKSLGSELYTFAKPDAAQHLAMVLLDIAKESDLKKQTHVRHETISKKRDTSQYDQ